ncbi:MAG: sugar transferase, partial [Planctomycetota bacterium]
KFKPKRRSGDRRSEDFGGEPFTIYKLRSMKIDAEKLTGAAWSTGDDDPRVTEVGRFIRKTHLDELPQFLNVTLGQMSIIGPRPERSAFITELSYQISGYRDRLNALPGITGLAQVNQDADESIEDVRRKLKYDKEYIENSCLMMDIKIVLKTVALIFSLILSSFEGRSTEQIDPKTADSFVPERVVTTTRR